jgi:hypothetical protein
MSGLVVINCLLAYEKQSTAVQGLLFTTLRISYVGTSVYAHCEANNGELKEIMRFQKLARADLKNNLSKKKMKTLIPQAVRATYIGGLLVLCAGSIVVSGSSFDAEEFLSFLTALALVVEPIQVN